MNFSTGTPFFSARRTESPVEKLNFDFQMRAYDNDLFFVFETDWKTLFSVQERTIFQYQLALFVTILAVILLFMLVTVWAKRHDRKYLKLKRDSKNLDRRIVRLISRLGLFEEF